MKNAANITVRQARPSDAAIITTFNARLAVESEGRTLNAATLRAGVDAALADPKRCIYFVAEIGGVVVGQLGLTSEWSDWRNGWFWWIQSVFVDAAHRGAGVYTALHTYAETAAKKAGDVCGLRLYVETENHRARETYSKLGMAKTHYLLYETDWSNAVSAQ